MWKTRDHDDKLLREEIAFLREQLRAKDREIDILAEAVLVLSGRRKHLAFIKIKFGGFMQGPVTLTIGQSTVATVLGFDQNGAPIAIDFTANPVTWAIDNPAFDSSTPAADGSDPIVSLAAGVANLSASVAGLTDTETITNLAVAPKLTSVKIDFSTPTP